MSYDDKGMAWLRIKNWERYQLDNRMRNKDAQLKYVLSWTSKFADVDYVKLSEFERFLYNEMIALTGTRPNRTLPNDPTWIGRSIHVSRTSMPRVKNALRTLIERGFIIPIVSEKFSEECGQNTCREGEGEGEGESTSVCQSVSDKEEADASLEEPQFELVDLEVAVHDLPCFTLLHDEFGREAELPEVVVRRVHSALKKLGKNEVWMQGCIQWALKHKWWSSRVVNAETFAKRLVSSTDDPDQKKFAAQYNRHVAQRRAAGAGKR